MKYTNLIGQSTLFFQILTIFWLMKLFTMCTRYLVPVLSQVHPITPLPFYFSLAANLVVYGYLFQSI